MHGNLPNFFGDLILKSCAFCIVACLGFEMFEVVSSAGALSKGERREYEAWGQGPLISNMVCSFWKPSRNVGGSGESLGIYEISWICSHVLLWKIFVLCHFVWFELRGSHCLAQEMTRAESRTAATCPGLKDWQLPNCRNLALMKLFVLHLDSFRLRPNHLTHPWKAMLLWSWQLPAFWFAGCERSWPNTAKRLGIEHQSTHTFIGDHPWAQYLLTSLHPCWGLKKITDLWVRRLLEPHILETYCYDIKKKVTSAWNWYPPWMLNFLALATRPGWDLLLRFRPWSAALGIALKHIETFSGDILEA